MLATRPRGSSGFGERAVALAREVSNVAITSHALTNIGTSQWLLERRGQPATMGEGLRITWTRATLKTPARVEVDVVWQLLDRYRLDNAKRASQRASPLTEEAEFLALPCRYIHVE